MRRDTVRAKQCRFTTSSHIARHKIEKRSWQVRKGAAYEDQEVFSDDRIRCGFDHLAAVWHLTQMVRSDISRRA